MKKRRERADEPRVEWSRGAEKEKGAEVAVAGDVAVVPRAAKVAGVNDVAMATATRRVDSAKRARVAKAATRLDECEVHADGTQYELRICAQCGLVCDRPCCDKGAEAGWLRQQEGRWVHMA